MITLSSFISWFNAAVAFGTVIMFGALGETLTEKSGHLNLGVPGIMYIGGIASLVGVFFYEKSTDEPNAVLCLLIALGCAFVASMLGGLIYSFLTITLRANQNVTGLTLTIFGSGVANFFGGSLNTLAGGVGQISVPATSEAFRTSIPWLSSGLGTVSKLFFSYGFLAYAAIAVAVAMQIFLSRSRVGLNLRAVGENPATADAAGINITLYKYLATCLGAGICGIGGLYYVLDYTKGTWSSDGSIESLGWLAVALVIFASWKPKNAIWSAYLFGMCYWLFLYLPASSYLPKSVIDSLMVTLKSSNIALQNMFQDIFKTLPYLVSIIVLVIVSARKKRENHAPASLGLPYFREER